MGKLDDLHSPRIPYTGDSEQHDRELARRETLSSGTDVEDGVFEVCLRNNVFEVEEA